VTKKVMEIISENVNAKFTVGSVDIAFFNRLRLKNVYIEDLYGDSLLYADQITSTILKLPNKRRIPLNTITLENATLRLATDSANTVNIRFIIDGLRRKDTTKAPRHITIKNIKFENSKFCLKTRNSDINKQGINFSNLVLNKFNANIKRFSKDADTVNFLIKSLSFVDHSGFLVNKFYANASISRNHLIFNNVKANTELSRISGANIALFFNSFKDFKPEVRSERVRLNLVFLPSDISLYDVAFISPKFGSSNQLIKLSGQIKGYINNLKGRNIRIRYGEKSKIHGEFNLNGLPNFRETFIYVNLKNFDTSVEEIESFGLPGGKKINLSERFKGLENIIYTGKFTGFIDDFVAYGDIRTNLGKISSDLLFKPDTSNYFTFNGELTAEEFNLGRLLNNEKNIGKITLNLNVDGSSCSGQTVNARLQGLINSLALKQYKYKNIKLSGVLSDKTYNGSINIKDPNINMEFLGKVDFSSEIYDVDFTANISRANLYALNFDKSDSLHTVSFYIKANAQGNSLNNINGEVKLLNSLFTKKDKQIQIYDFSLYASNSADSNSFSIRSDFVDADIYGNYQMAEINESLLKFISSYLPAFVNPENLTIKDFKNGFHFTADFKKPKPIFDYFLPEYSIAENTIIKVEFDPDTNHLFLFIRSPKIKFHGNTWNNVYFNCQSDDRIFTIVSGSKSLVLKEEINLENFTIYSDISGDSINFITRWNNWDTLLYKGALKAVTKFKKSATNKFPLISVNILPANIVTADTLWNVNGGKILIDSSSISVDNFSINHNRQYLRIDGKISVDPVDELAVEFNNFNLENFNVFTRSGGFEIKGILNGNASVTDFYKNTMFYSSLIIDTLVINNESLGYTIINSKWNNNKKSIGIRATAKRGQLNTFAINGDYFPKDDGKIKLNIELNKLRLKMINPYMNNVFSDFNGIVTGNLELTGKTSEPLINGDLKFQRTAFTINYLKSRYNFTDRIKIVNNNVYFDNIRFNDIYGNFAFLNGSVHNKYFKNFNFNIKIDADNLLFLNTTQSDNKHFYGTAFASGYVALKGAPRNIKIDAGVRTEKNTRFFIPLANEGEISKYNFVTFLYEDTAGQSEINNNEYKVDLSAINLNVDLEVTRDAEVQLIFDPKVGDIMKSKGFGNINLQINTLGKFKMFGEYYIEEGDYLFTLQNVINRKFNIDYGVIKWSGDILDADIDIKAIYPTKASLYELFGVDITGEESIKGSEENMYRRKTTVYCQLIMTDKLMKPNVKYDIYLPTVDEETRNLVRNEINTDEELNKQFISLLVLNRFMPGSAGQASTADNSFYSPYSNAAGVNASEFLSNQLSHWLSQISNDYDIRINYHPNFDNEMTNDEVELALSTQLLNDRLSINGNVDVTTNATAESSNNIVGDFDLDYKITEKLRLKAYNHSNDNLLTEVSPYTQGVGVVFKEEFNSIGELWKRYLRSIFGKRNKNNQKK
jgi:hypothetical protein